MESIVSTLNGIIWSPFLIYLCLGAGLFYSIMTRFVQVRYFFEMWRLLFSGQSSERGISPFQALAVSLSGRVGTGNIAGVAAAIGFGGPGAIFWMWVVAFLGAATAYTESTLGQIYKEEGQLTGQFRGGPAYYFEKCLGQTWYGILFAIATIVSCGVFLPGVQANAIASAVENVVGNMGNVNTGMGEFSIVQITVSTIVMLLLGFIIFGGVKRIANFTQIVVPFMALTYIIIACVIVALNLSEVPALLKMIVSDAFSPMAGIGAAIGWGVKRGVYSNEAGQGTGPHAASAAEVQHPAQQGLVQAFSVYVDTLFVCTATALMILLTGMYNVHGATEGAFLVQNIATDISPNSPTFTQLAVDSVFAGMGGPFVAFALFFFSFTTVLAYYYIAETNIAYLYRFVRIPGLKFVLKMAVMAAVLYGGINASGYIWGIGDIGVGLMAWLNIVGILVIFFISKPALIALKDYDAQKKAKVKNYTFDPVKLGIKNATFWEKQNKQ